MKERVFQIETREDLERCFPVMKELRPHLTLEEYLSIYFEAHSADGYELVALQEKGEILALMGYRVLSDFVRGRHLYVDDLVTSEKARSQGLGAELLEVAEVVAQENGIQTLRLCTGIDNVRGVKFYEKNGWTKRAFSFTKSLFAN